MFIAPPDTGVSLPADSGSTGTFRESARVRRAEDEMQGVVKSYDPVSGDGLIMCDTDLKDYELAPNAIEGSIFRMLRQGQRVVFDLDSQGRAAKLRMGSEVDMSTPGH